MTIAALSLMSNLPPHARTTLALSLVRLRGFPGPYRERLALEPAWVAAPWPRLSESPWTSRWRTSKRTRPHWAIQSISYLACSSCSTVALPRSRSSERGISRRSSTVICRSFAPSISPAASGCSVRNLPVRTSLQRMHPVRAQAASCNKQPTCPCSWRRPTLN